MAHATQIVCLHNFVKEEKSSTFFSAVHPYLVQVQELESNKHTIDML